MYLVAWLSHETETASAVVTASRMAAGILVQLMMCFKRRKSANATWKHSRR